MTNKWQAEAVHNLVSFVRNDPEQRYEIVEFNATDAGTHVVISRTYKPRGLKYVHYNEVFVVGPRGGTKRTHFAVH